MAEKPWTFKEWVARFAEQAQPYYGEGEDDEFVDGPLTEGMPGGDEMYDDLDSDLIESAIIVGLVVALGLLVYYRNQRQNNAQQRQQQQQQAQGQAPVPAPPLVQGQAQPPLPGQQADGGFFPPAGDPNHAEWAVGGVGH